MSSYVPPLESENWICANCNVPLETTRVMIAYLDNAFPVDLPRCPRCGQVFIPESLALGKMAEVEKSLEDK
ncbi:MAG: zf-TFIIB domain-containing protein [Anaerolineae bacterium]|nr:zf-TFIIB domain-containing protein [Anaerolineae bacterium]